MLKFLSVEVYILYPSILTCFPLYLKSFFFFFCIFIEFLLDLELYSVPLQKQYTLLKYCLENPPSRIMCNSARVFAQNITDWSKFPFCFLLLLRTSREKCLLPSSEHCYAIYTWCSGLLMLRLTCNHHLQREWILQFM